MQRPIGRRRCRYCGKRFKVYAYETKKIFCNKRCQSKNWKTLQLPVLSTKYGLSSSNAGALSELIVGADLLRKGYHVFRSLSPACPCDLIALSEDGVLLRVEVRTKYPKLNSDQRMKCMREILSTGKCDLVALVSDEKIYYSS